MSNSASTRDQDVLKKIVQYCDEINHTTSYFGKSYQVFSENSIYRNAVAMCILQIGELGGSLSDEFRETQDVIPWRNIKDMRNVMAHRYGLMDHLITWETVVQDIPFLRDFMHQNSFISITVLPPGGGFSVRKFGTGISYTTYRALVSSVLQYIVHARR